jgi:hypothetical protein
MTPALARVRFGREELSVMFAPPRRIAALVGTTFAVVALGLTTSPTAGADATSEDFFRQISADGVDFGTHAETVRRAHNVCTGFSGGMSAAKVHEMVLGGGAFTSDQTTIFMADAVRAFCPQYAGQLTG